MSDDAQEKFLATTLNIVADRLGGLDDHTGPSVNMTKRTITVPLDDRLSLVMKCSLVNEQSGEVVLE